jgi:hypothetical protein
MPFHGKRGFDEPAQSARAGMLDSKKKPGLIFGLFPGWR